MKKFKILFIFIIMIQFSCAGIRIQNLIPENYDKNFNPTNKSIYLSTVDHKFLPFNHPQEVKSEKFITERTLLNWSELHQALLIALKQTNIFTIVDKKDMYDYELIVHILTQQYHAKTMKEHNIRLDIEYIILDKSSQEILYQNIIRTDQKKSWWDIFPATEAQRQCYENAVKANIKSFIENAYEEMSIIR